MRTLRIPRLFHEFHGEEARLIDVVFTWAAALIAVGIVVLRPSTRPVATTWWQIAIVALIAGDLVGGVVANFSEGTDRYYAARPRLRVGFLLLHVVQPTVLYFIIGGPVEVWASIPAYAIVAALVVNALPDDRQMPVATLLTAIGIMICFGWYVIAPPALWFGPIFLVKLVLGFAVRRTK
jgi:hypothetical protein